MKRGFTLVETLVALLMLSVALGGTYAAITSNLAVATLARNTALASALAQEGVEVVRNIRDNDWLAGRAFGESLSLGSEQRVEWNSLALLAPDAGAYLRKSVDGLYSYEPTDAATQFRRTVDVVKVRDDEYAVTVAVTWQERTVLKSVSTEEHLYNWY